MTEQIKTDFEKIVKTSAFSEKDVELKRMYLNKFWFELIIKIMT